MQDSNFKPSSQNPLTEISELRLELEKNDLAFDVVCRLRFGKMEYEHKDREYEIGVSKAYLRLTLEGCETALNGAFGESIIPSILEEERIENKGSANAGLGASARLDKSVDGSFDLNADVSRERTHIVKRSQIHLPVTAKPNNSWEIKPKEISGKTENLIDGTAVPDSKLCSIKRKQGGNRISLLGEVQVTKSSLKVRLKGGNFLNKALLESQNRDAIVSQVIRKAIEREASNSDRTNKNSIIVISRSEVLED